MLSPPIPSCCSFSFTVKTHPASYLCWLSAARSMPEPPSPPSPVPQHSDMEPKTSLPHPTASASRSYDLEGSSSSSPWRTRAALLHLPSDTKHKVEESDDDLFRVPDVEALLPSDSTCTTAGAGAATTNASSNPEVQQQSSGGKRRRGRNPADREYRRLKRLLRNRVSAQQARERKKVYVNELESKAQELQDRNSRLEEKISTLVNENTMLRKVLMNTRPKVDESSSAEPKHDQLDKS